MPCVRVCVQVLRGLPVVRSQACSSLCDSASERDELWILEKCYACGARQPAVVYFVHVFFCLRADAPDGQHRLTSMVSNHNTMSFQACCSVCCGRR
jgi:heterodisulfide reductase subunit C